MKITLVNGFWGQNIGNSFFNFGGTELLKSLAGNESVSCVYDHPNYRTFARRQSSFPKNFLNYFENLRTDFLVLQGPIFSSSFPILWNNILPVLKRRGVKIVFLSSSFFRHNTEEISLVRNFLTFLKPYAVCTRDSETYSALKNFVNNIHDGIDTSFFVPDFYDPVDLNLGNYVTFTFDRFHEPLTTFNSRTGLPVSEEDLSSFRIIYPTFLNFFSSKNKWLGYISSLLDFRSLPDSFGDFKIVRPHHRYTPYIPFRALKRSNAFVSDEPYTYFSLYKNSSFTFSDRVHACAITLAFGKPAMLHEHTKRSLLLKRVGAVEIEKRPASVNSLFLKTEKENMIRFLKNVFS